MDQNEKLKCPRCASKRSVELFVSSDTARCPCCRKAYNEADLRAIRVAQFGGVGGSVQPNWGPGASPTGAGGQGKSYSSGHGYPDDSLDVIIQRTHRPVPIDPHRNIEKRLEPQHAHAEENSIPYDLSFEDRKKLRIKQQIKRREESYQESARSIYESSPEFIRQHFPIKPEHAQTVEQSLMDKRKEEHGVIPRQRIHDSRYAGVRLSDLKLPKSLPNDLSDENGVDEFGRRRETTEQKYNGPMDVAEHQMTSTPASGWIEHDEQNGDQFSQFTMEENLMDIAQDGYNPGTALPPQESTNSTPQAKQSANPETPETMETRLRKRHQTLKGYDIPDDELNTLGKFEDGNTFDRYEAMPGQFGG